MNIFDIFLKCVVSIVLIGMLVIMFFLTCDFFDKRNMLNECVENGFKRYQCKAMLAGGKNL